MKLRAVTVSFVCLNKHSLDHAREIGAWGFIGYTIGPGTTAGRAFRLSGRSRGIAILRERGKEALGAVCLMHRPTFPCQTSLFDSRNLKPSRCYTHTGSRLRVRVCVRGRAMTGKLLIFIYWITVVLSDEVR